MEEVKRPMSSPNRVESEHKVLTVVGFFALVAIVLYLAVNNKVVNVSPTPFVKQADGTYLMKKGEVICEDKCPAVLTPNVNLYKTTGGIMLGNMTIMMQGNGDLTFSIQNTIIARARNGATSIGSAEVQNMVPGGLYVAGMVPDTQNAFDFATTLTTFTLLAHDGSTVYIDRVAEKSGFLRQGWRVRFQDTQYTFFVSPQPQIIIGNPNARYITNNADASVITEAESITQAAYPCVLGPFRDSSSQLVIKIHQFPSTCDNEIEGYYTQRRLLLKDSLTCMPVTFAESITNDLVSTTTYPNICFSPSACHYATSTIPANQQMTIGNLSVTDQSVQLGCTPISGTGVQFSVRCTRSTL